MGVAVVVSREPIDSLCMSAKNGSFEKGESTDSYKGFSVWLLRF